MKEGADVDVSDEEAAQKSMKYVYFEYKKTDEDGNSEDMTDEEKAELKATAEKFAKDLKSDKKKDIDAAAKKAELKVETVTFDSDKKVPFEDFVLAADKLKENEVTDAIESDGGLYVGKVTSLLDREATDAKKEQIIENREFEQYNALIEKWRGETEIVLNEEEWQKIGFAYQGITALRSKDAADDKTSDDAVSNDGKKDDTQTNP